MGKRVWLEARGMRVPAAIIADCSPMVVSIWLETCSGTRAAMLVLVTKLLKGTAEPPVEGWVGSAPAVPGRCCGYARPAAWRMRAFMSGAAGAVRRAPPSNDGGPAGSA